MKKSAYLRIGTQYYKKIKTPLISGDVILTLAKWSRNEIRLDKGNDYLKKIPKYDGFCLIPSHTNYQPVIKKFYNKYSPNEHISKEGDFQKTKAFLKHLFSNKFNLILDYLTILWQKPTQTLPVLCLVSEERKTGKSTFLNWLKIIFQANMTINTNEDFRSRFNDDWISKLIIAVDEVLLDKKEDSEKIKNLSTTKSYKQESKGVDKIENEFFGKFILCSNNEDNFIKIDRNEIRYWVVKIPTIKDEEENPKLLDDLRKELPHFIYFIENRKIVTSMKTRMWFTREQLHTPALEKLIRGNTNSVERELNFILNDAFKQFDVEKLEYTLTDIVNALAKSGINTTKRVVSNILKNNLKLESINGNYKKHHLTPTLSGDIFGDYSSSKGRYFTFLKKDF